MVVTGVSNVHRLHHRDCIFFVTVNLRPRFRRFNASEYDLLISVLVASRRRLGFSLCAEFLRGLLSLPGNGHVEIPILRAAKESKLRLPLCYRLAPLGAHGISKRSECVSTPSACGWAGRAQPLRGALASALHLFGWACCLHCGYRELGSFCC
jgi:hypothetical protein